MKSLQKRAFRTFRLFLSAMSCNVLQCRYTLSGAKTSGDTSQPIIEMSSAVCPTCLIPFLMRQSPRFLDFNRNKAKMGAVYLMLA